MPLKIETGKGWTEAIIDEDCSPDKFALIAGILESELHLTFTAKLGHHDSYYWDFEYKGSALCLYYNNYTGVSLFPLGFEGASRADNDRVVELGNLLLKKLVDFDWIPFNEGKSIGNKGSENGTIILDLENTNGARITLEKDCGNIPFAVTLGVYGLMLHTHFEKHLTGAEQFVTDTRLRINKLFELELEPEENQDDQWVAKRDQLVSEIAEITG